ncbi:hypothetical protein MITS9508_02184 [Synechococcus sp. MIT S9508]|nr:hypothetical protein MITS9508_02184 [Synechococcus sp. MIT S9508]
MMYQSHHPGWLCDTRAVFDAVMFFGCLIAQGLQRIDCEHSFIFIWIGLIWSLMLLGSPVIDSCHAAVLAQSFF